MKHIKDERLKKLEAELIDLDQWLKLGLVPKKDIDKHKQEIQVIKGKIGEEKERLQLLRESGEVEEYSAPKRSTNRPGYNEMPTIPDVDVGETMGEAEASFEMETNALDIDQTIEERGEEEEERGEEEEETTDESYFSDRNRWRRGGIRGGIIDPDANDW
jgi:hypothetical protein